MNVVDFGKNVFQSEIAFKFDCLSPDSFLRVADYFLQKNSGWYVGKDPQTGHSLITRGTGTPEHPFLQIKLLAHSVTFWVGWHVPYDSWFRWIDKTIGEMADLSSNLPPSFVAHLATQAVIGIPDDKIKKITDIPEFQPLYSFARRYLTDEYVAPGARGGGSALFIDVSGTRTIETQSGGNPATKLSTYSFLHRWTALDGKKTLRGNYAEHLECFDALFQKYHQAFISLVAKNGTSNQPSSLSPGAVPL